VNDKQRTPNDEQRTPMEEAALAIYVHAAELIKQGKSPDEVRQQLITQGVRPDTARTVLERLMEARVNVAKRRGQRNVFIGVAVSILAAIALLGTAVSGAAQVMSVIILGCGLFALVHGIRQITGI